MTGRKKREAESSGEEYAPSKKRDTKRTPTGPAKAQANTLQDPKTNPSPATQGPKAKVFPAARVPKAKAAPAAQTPTVKISPTARDPKGKPSVAKTKKAAAARPLNSKVIDDDGPDELAPDSVTSKEHDKGLHPRTGGLALPKQPPQVTPKAEEPDNQGESVVGAASIMPNTHEVDLASSHNPGSTPSAHVIGSSQQSQIQLTSGQPASSESTDASKLSLTTAPGNFTLRPPTTISNKDGADSLLDQRVVDGSQVAQTQSTSAHLVTGAPTDATKPPIKSETEMRAQPFATCIKKGSVSYMPDLNTTGEASKQPLSTISTRNIAASTPGQVNATDAPQLGSNPMKYNMASQHNNGPSAPMQVCGASSASHDPMQSGLPSAGRGTIWTTRLAPADSQQASVQQPARHIGPHPEIEFPPTIWASLEQHFKNNEAWDERTRLYMLGIQAGIGYGISNYKECLVTEIMESGRLWGMPVLFQTVNNVTPSRADVCHWVRSIDAMDVLAAMQAGNHFLSIRREHHITAQELAKMHRDVRPPEVVVADGHGLGPNPNGLPSRAPINNQASVPSVQADLRMVAGAATIGGLDLGEVDGLAGALTARINQQGRYELPPRNETPTLARMGYLSGAAGGVVRGIPSLSNNANIPTTNNSQTSNHSAAEASGPSNGTPMLSETTNGRAVLQLGPGEPRPVKLVPKKQ
ncbi:hypothetical protein BJ170DRAFT_46790 [Xylariales sp. AK1849]|nr:hypothetical protein BJ170DRAFT_46790 [Xylariales sp. AK1849]